MKPFPLAGLLRLRGIQQDEAAGHLASSNRHLQSLKERRTRAFADLSTTAADPDSPTALLAIAAARASSRSMLTEMEALTVVATTNVCDAQRQFTAARMSAVSLEKMQNKHVEAETFRELGVEQNALDEISVNTFRTGQP